MLMELDIKQYIRRRNHGMGRIDMITEEENERKSAEIDKIKQ
jgi:hypothetical protein